MLEYIRQRAQGIIAWIIVGFLVLAFATWGVNEFFSGEEKIFVAEVDGQPILPKEFQRQFQQQMARFQSMFGQQFDPATFDRQAMKTEVLESVIDRELQLIAARDGGLHISNDALSKEINNIPAIQKDGRIDKEVYLDFVRQLEFNGIQDFEDYVREELLLVQLRRGLMQSGFMTPNESERIIKLRGQKRDFGYAVVAYAPFIAKATVTEDQIKQYYQENAARFATPEQVAIEYVELSQGQLAASVTVSDGEVREYYDSHGSEFGLPETRKARHILLAVDSPEADAKAQAQAEELLQRIKKGESFEALAQQYSADPGSAKQGGDLGYFGHGVMDPAFEKATFALAKGEVSAPVKSAFGYHLIRVDDIKRGEKKPFAEVKATIYGDLIRSKAEQLYYDQSEKLNTLAFEQPDSLEPAAKAVGLTIKSTDLFARDLGAGIADNPKIRSAAFDEEMISKGTNSEPIEIAPQHVVIFRVKQHVPASQRPLEEVTPQIKAELQEKAAQALAEQSGQALLAALRQGKDPQAAVQAVGLRWQRSGLIDRASTAQVPAAVTNEAFRAPRPQAKQPSFHGAKLASGDYAVLEVYQVQDADPAKAGEAMQRSVRENSVRSEAEVVLRAYIDDLKSKAKIKRYPNNL